MNISDTVEYKAGIFILLLARYAEMKPLICTGFMSVAVGNTITPQTKMRNQVLTG